MGEVTPERSVFAHDVEYMSTFEEAVRKLKPTALIGLLKSICCVKILHRPKKKVRE